MSGPTDILIALLRAGRGLPPSFDFGSASPGDWAPVPAEARRHGLTPYLFRKLRPREDFRPPVAVPEEILSALQRDYLGNVSANLVRFHFLGNVLRSLGAAGVPAIVLKGGYLAEAVYGDVSLRVMSDLDLLVRRESLPAAAAVLQAAGFDTDEYCLEPPTDLQEFPFVHRKTRAVIELHWEVFKPLYPFGFTPEVVWGGAVPAKIAGAEALALSPTDLLCHLAAHAAIHSFNTGLKTLVDAAEAIDRLSVDWARFADRARCLKSVRPVWVMLALSRRLLGAAVPEDVLGRLAPARGGESLFDAARERILLRGEGRASRSVLLPTALLVFDRKGIREKVGLVFRKAFPSRAALAAKFQISPRSPLVFLYYPRWIGRLVRRYAPDLRARLSPHQARAAGRTDEALMSWVISGE